MAAVEQLVKEMPAVTVMTTSLMALAVREVVLGAAEEEQGVLELMPTENVLAAAAVLEYRLRLLVLQLPILQAAAVTEFPVAQVQLAAVTVAAEEEHRPAAAMADKAS